MQMQVVLLMPVVFLMLMQMLTLMQIVVLMQVLMPVVIDLMLTLLQVVVPDAVARGQVLPWSCRLSGLWS